MDSKTSLVARQYRLQQWTTQIRECQNRDPELTVKEWCSQRELNVATYYYRLGQVRRTCLENIPETALSQSIVPVPSELMNQNSQAAGNSGLELTINQMCIHVTTDTSPELLKMVLQVAADVK